MVKLLVVLFVAVCLKAAELREVKTIVRAPSSGFIMSNGSVVNGGGSEAKEIYYLYFRGHELVYRINQGNPYGEELWTVYDQSGESPRRLADLDDLAAAKEYVADLNKEFDSKHGEKPKAENQTSKPVIFGADVMDFALPDNLGRLAREAVDEWSYVLGRKVEMPKFNVGTQFDCGWSAALACVDIHGGYEITLCADTLANHAGSSIYFEEEMRTIFMHEIGHLLNVPHMNGDDLMNPVLSEPIGKPSAPASALAIRGAH